MLISWNFCTIKADRLHSVGADQSYQSDWALGRLPVRLQHRLSICQTGADKVSWCTSISTVYLSVRLQHRQGVLLYISLFYHSVRLEQMRCLDASTSVLFICQTKAQTSWSPNSKHWFTTSFLQPLPYLDTPLVPKNCQLTSSFLLVLKL